MRKLYLLFTIFCFIALSIYPLIASKAYAGINTSFFFGSSAHPEDVFQKSDPATMTQPLTAGTRTIADYDRWLRAASASAHTWVRGGMTFDSIAATSSVKAGWDWSYQDLWIDKVKSAGMEPLILVAYGAPWLANPLDAAASSAGKTEFINAFADFAGELAARYASKIKYYEIWNEPSLTTFWNWSRPDFAQLLAETSYRIKQNDPDAHVMFDTHALDHMINPALAFGGQGTFAVQVVNATVTRSDSQSVTVIDAIDGIAPHSYPDRTSDIPEDLLSGRFEMGYFYYYMDQYLRNRYGNTRGAKEYWMTEVGWTTRNSNLTSRWVSQPKQAALIIRTFLNLLANPHIKGIIQYDIQNDGNDTTEFEHNYGLTEYALDLNGDLVGKTAYTAWQHFMNTLDGTNFVSSFSARIDSDKSDKVYLFKNPNTNRKVWGITYVNALTPLGALNISNTSSVTLSGISTPTVSTKQLDGTVITIGTATGSATFVTTENPFFVMEPATISNIDSSGTSTSKTVTWDTSEAASSKIDYGVSKGDYASSSAETDTSTRVTSHAVTLSNLLPCSRYHYRLRSKIISLAESLDGDNYFSTAGCTGNASILDATSSAITRTAGGSVALTNGSSNIEVTVPASFGPADATFQIDQLTKSSVIASISTPTGYTAVGSHVYELKALTNPTQTLSSFTNPLTVEITYSDSDINGIDESTLAVYRYDGSSWNTLSGCTLSLSSNTISCPTTAFSIFILFGQETTSNGSSNNSSTSSNSLNGNSPRSCSAQTPPNAPWLYGAIPKSNTSIEVYFTKADDPYTNYVIEYGTKSGVYEYSVNTPNDKTLRTYLIQSLNANKTYYFRIRAGNGCQAGSWSGEIVATTSISKTTLPIVNTQITAKDIPSLLITPSPKTTPTPIENPSKEGYSVTIKVVDTNKQNIAGAKVTLHSTPREGVTDSNGIAQFHNVEGGQHTVLIAYNGFEGEQSLLLQGEAKEINLNITIEAKNKPFSIISVSIIGILAGIVLLLFLLLLRRARQ